MTPSRVRWRGETVWFPALSAVVALAAGCASRSPFDDALANLAEYHPHSIIPDASVNPAIAGLAAESAAESAPEIERPEGSLTLPAAIDRALLRNPSTRAQWERVRAAAAVVERAQSAYLPRIALEGSAGQSRFLYPTTDGAQTSTGFQGEGAATLTWRLVDFGRRDARTATAAQMLRATSFDFQRRVQKLVYEVQSAYFRLAAARVTEEAARMTVEFERTSLADIEEQTVLGLLTRPDALEARREFTRANYEYESARAVTYDARAALAVVLGLPANEAMRVATLDELVVPSGIDASVDALVATALGARPDIGAAIARVAAARESVKHAEAEFMPTIDLAGSFGFMDMDLNSYMPGSSGPADSFQTQWGIGLEGSWLVYDGGERAATLRGARASQSEAEHELESIRLEATGEVWDAYFDIVANRRRLEAAEALVASAKDSYDAIHEAYVTGLTTSTELIELEASLADARGSYAIAKSGLLESMARLAYAAGQ